MIYTALVYMLISFVIAYFVTPWTKKIAFKRKILDHPSDVKIHERPIPRTGGIAIVVASMISMVLFLAFILEIKIMLLILAMLIIAITGIADDIKGSTPIQKLFRQAIAAFIFAVAYPFIGHFSALFGGFIVFLFVLLVCNAMNLIDGLDGLAAGLSTIAALSFVVLGIMKGNFLVIGLSTILVGATLGFLPYNWHPAQVFMGDTGSLFLGFTLAAISVILVQKTDFFFELLIPVVVLGIPLFDIILTIIRRIIHKKALFEADLAHSYNLVQGRGLTDKGVVVFYYGLGILLGICGVLIEYGRTSNLPVFIVVVTFAIFAYLTIKLGLLAEEKKQNGTD